MIKARALLVTMFMLIGFVIITGHLANIQLVKHERYKQIALNQQDEKTLVPAERGVLKDALGKVVAYTKNDYSFYVNLGQIKGWKRDSIANRFSEVFGKSKSYYSGLMDSTKGRVCLAKKAPFQQAVLLRDLVFDGFTAEADYTRRYPEGRLASHLVGFVNTKNIGKSGVEKEFEDELKGKDGIILKQTDVLGKTVAIQEDFSFPPVKGNTVNLTLNSDYQKILEEELLAGLNNFKGAAATGVIMNPKTGAILALSNIPDYEPNKYGEFGVFERKNRAITDVYEPGSTIKPIVIAMMMEQGIVDLDEKINVENGKYRYHTVRIKDTHPANNLSVRGVLYESSNIGMVKLSERIADDTFYKYLRSFGFGNPTSVDLPGEAAGFLKKPNDYSKVSKAYMSHGYEISVTPLQLSAAFCALINGGMLYQPHIVKSVEAADGSIIKENEGHEIRRVVSKEVSDSMKSILLNVVEIGTGHTAQLPDVYVGGKTGTSQKWNGEEYSRNDYNSSFIGFLPADDPNLVIYVLVHSPQKGKYGGKVGGPIFREIAQRIVEMDVNVAPEKEKIVREKNVLHNLITEVSSTNEQTERRLLLNPSNEIDPEVQEEAEFFNKTVMPDLRGLSKREAIRHLSEIGLQYSIQGTGKVFSQSIAPGRRIISGEKCTIKCKLVKSIRYN